MAVVVVLYLRSIAVTVRQSGLVLVILAACLTWRVDPLPEDQHHD